MMLKRYCVVIEVQEEHIKEYIDIHKNAWPELMTAIKESGAENLIIYNYKKLSILFYECEDIDKFYEIFGEKEIAGKWNAAVHKWFKESPVLDGSGSVDTLEKIFDLNQQLAGKLEQF